jgi:hypothetical protein
MLVKSRYDVIPEHVEIMIVAAARFQYPGSNEVFSFNTTGTALVVAVSARVSSAKNAKQSRTASRLTVSEDGKALRSQFTGTWARFSDIVRG